jgi:hypothetical protein
LGLACSYFSKSLGYITSLFEISVNF